MKRMRLLQFKGTAKPVTAIVERRARAICALPNSETAVDTLEFGRAIFRAPNVTPDPYRFYGWCRPRAQQVTCLGTELRAPANRALGELRGAVEALPTVETKEPPKNSSWLLALMLLVGASWASITAFSAGDIATASPTSCGPQFMLYVTVPLSSGGSWSLPRYGLRVGEFRKRPTTIQLVAVAPVPRELMDLRVDAHSDIRVEFAQRLVWDIPRGAFGPQSNLPTLALGVLLRVSEPVNQQPRQPWNPASSAMSASAADPMRTRQVDGEATATWLR